MASRKYHYQKAEELLEIAESYAEVIADLNDKGLPAHWAFEAHQGALAAAQVHATLATTELFVAGA